MFGISSQNSSDFSCWNLCHKFSIELDPWAMRSRYWSAVMSSPPSSAKEYRKLAGWKRSSVTFLCENEHSVTLITKVGFISSQKLKLKVPQRVSSKVACTLPLRVQNSSKSLVVGCVSVPWDIHAVWKMLHWKSSKKLFVQEFFILCKILQSHPLLINTAILQGEPLRCSQPPVDTTTKVVLWYTELCFSVKGRLGKTWRVTLYVG